MVDEGGLSLILEALGKDLQKREGLDLSECFIDGTVVVAATKRARVTRFFAHLNDPGVFLSAKTVYEHCLPQVTQCVDGP